MSERILKLPIRHYQIAQVYGPGMPPSGREGLKTKTLEKPVGRIGLVLVHCWNVGEADGPYPIGADDRLPGQAGDWVPEAHRIIAEQIQPVLAEARRVGMPVFHLAQETYAGRYTSYQRIKDDPDLQAPITGASASDCVRRRPLDEEIADVYGSRFPGCIWQTDPVKFDIAKAVRPTEDEYVFLNGWQLNGICRRLDIDTLLYAGFMTDLCLLNIPGAIREMVRTFGYRCIVLRDCTTAYEY